MTLSQCRKNYSGIQTILQYIVDLPRLWGSRPGRSNAEGDPAKGHSDHIWGGWDPKDWQVGIVPWWRFGFQPNFLGLLNQVIMAKPVEIYVLHGMFVCVRQFVLCLYFNPPKRLGGKMEDVNNPVWLTVGTEWEIFQIFLKTSSFLGSFWISTLRAQIGWKALIFFTNKLFQKTFWLALTNYFQQKTGEAWSLVNMSGARRSVRERLLGNTLGSRYQGGYQGKDILHKEFETREENTKYEWSINLYRSSTYN